jgi:hypothetical protein
VLASQKNGDFQRTLGQDMIQSANLGSIFGEIKSMSSRLSLNPRFSFIVSARAES